MTLLRVVEHLAVAVAQDVGRVPAGEAEHAGLQRRREDGLHQRLAGLEVFPADRGFVLARELEHHGQVDREVRGAVSERDPFHE